VRGRLGGLAGAASLLTLAGIVACAGSSSAGRLEAAWTGADTAKFDAPVTGLWCSGERFLELSAVQADTGIGLVLYPTDSLVAGDYPLFDPRGGTVTRPGAVVASRWFSQTLIKGYQSDSGMVTLRFSPSRKLSGQFGGRLHTVQGSGVLQLRGGFSEVRLGSSPLSCPSDTLRSRADSGVS
jgi:hypothetical protein